MNGAVGQFLLVHADAGSGWKQKSKNDDVLKYTLYRSHAQNALVDVYGKET
jgi:hypothetical protein